MPVVVPEMTRSAPRSAAVITSSPAPPPASRTARSPPSTARELHRHRHRRGFQRHRAGRRGRAARRYHHLRRHRFRLRRRRDPGYRGRHATDTTAGTVALDEIGDDVITAAERGADLVISGTTTGIEDGQVAATVNSTATTTPAPSPAGFSASPCRPPRSRCSPIPPPTSPPLPLRRRPQLNPGSREHATPPIPPPAPSRSTRSAMT